MKNKTIDLKEFKDEGYLQEVNRRFFHPHGLEMSIIVEKDGSFTFGGIIDGRDDPEGFYFEKITEDHLNKASNIRNIEKKRITPRFNAFGFVVQQIF